MLGGVSYAADGLLDPRPQAGSPALSDVLPGAPLTTAYRGAFSPNGNWADGWTALATEGHLKPASTVVGPTITTQPAAEVTVFPRETVTLTVEASGDEPLNYQWAKDGAGIEGATESSLVLENVQPTDAGTYTVTVSNGGGSVTSEASVVTVTFETFDDWAAGAGLTGDDAELDADPDLDGIINLFEYAFGGNPNGDSSGRLPAADEVSEEGVVYASLTFTRNQSGVGGEIQVEAAADVLFATPVEIVLAGVQDLGDGTERVTWRTVSPAAELEGVFWQTSIVIP